jgi:FkbM family methyltransferase
MKDSVIIDAGAFILDTALILREYFPHNKIIAFEPSKVTYERGVKTRELNNLQNIEYINIGLGNKNEKSIFYTDNSGDYGHGNHIKFFPSSTNWKNETIMLCTLDSYVQEHGIQKVGLIKSDVEGFESQLIEGAIKTIREHRPILLLSIYHNYNDFYRMKPYLESLDLGYKFDFFSNKYEKTNVEIILIAETY